MTSFRTRCAVVTAVLAGLAAYTAAAAQQSPERPVGSKVRVGTFDSRAVALAYYRSAAFPYHMDRLKAEYEKAKATRNKKRRKELEAESSDPTWPDSGWPPSQAQQELIDKQVFSTWPVDNVLTKIKGGLPEIAKEADVDVIVSQWDIVYEGPGVEFVDVTDLMVRPFRPGQDILRMVEQMKAQEPVPLEEIGHDHD